MFFLRPGPAARAPVLLVILALGALAQPAAGQIASAALVGDVRDGTGQAVPGAIVTLTDPARGATWTAVTDAGGRYTLRALPPGAFDVRVDLAGFRPVVRRGIALATGNTVRVDLQLQLGGMSETVVVTSADPLLRSESSGLGHVVDHRSVVDLPLDGRSYVSLAALAPGVALPPSSQLPRINGGRPRTNEYLFDGISVLQPEPGQVAYFPNVDAIQEFRIESNSPPAEFGRFNGGVVNLTTRSGTNAVHGTAFEFLRDEHLNARNAFAPAGGARPAFRRQQFGGVLGGPVRRDRTFFFADYQGQRQTIGRTVISTVPTLLQRQGVFTEPVGGRVPAIYDPASTAGGIRQAFPGSRIPLDRLDPVARRLLERYPLPTAPGTANNYRRVGEERVDQDMVGLRLDHRLGSGRDHVFGRLTRFDESFVPVTPLPDGSGRASGTLGPQRTRSWAFASGHQHVFAGSLVNELRVGDTRRHVDRDAASLPGPASASLGLPGVPDTGRFADTLPTFLIAGYQQLGSPPSTATAFGTRVTQLADTLTWIRGAHTVKAGADLRWERLDVVQPPSPTGAFTFSSLFTDQPGTAGTGFPLASFLLGQVDQFSIDLQQEQIRNRAHVQEYFVQDDWRISDRVTVNAGLRYTLNFPSTEQQDQVGVFNLETRQMEYLGRNGLPRAARQLHLFDLGPRLGVVGRLTDRTVARVGYARVFIEMAGITTPFTTPAFPFLQTVSQRSLDGVAPACVLADGPTVEPIPLTGDAGLGQGVFSVDRDLGSGDVQQWNVSIQRALGSHLAVEAAYVGSKITHVGIPDSNLNQLTVEQLALGEALLERVPNPWYGVVPRSSSLGDPTVPLAQLLKPYPQYTTVSLYRNNVGTTIYHGVYATLEQRPLHGLSYRVSYTRSTLRDDASSVFDAAVLTGPVANYPVADSFNRRLERDVSTGDIPHVFVASAVWDLPAGDGRRYRPRGLAGAILRDWTLTGILRLQSGTPVAVTQATNTNAFAGFGTQRPNLVGDPRLPSSERSTAAWFDTGAFALAAPFTLGSSSRNPVRGPAYRNLDLALMRRVPLAGRADLELRVEAFNVTNTPPLGQPNGVFGSAGFGTITSAGDPRVIQLAAKVRF
ncbi:MAG: TonB-dependent receptor [Vicinamibacterales bacterium]